jgi:predicted phage tail protein
MKRWLPLLFLLGLVLGVHAQGHHRGEPALRLSAAAGSTPGTQLSATGIAFLNVILGEAEVSKIAVTSSGTAPLHVTAAAISGEGLSVSDSLPVTLQPGASTVISVTWDPTAPGTLVGASLTIATNATSPKILIYGSAFAPTSTPSYKVELTWTPGTGSTDAAVSYDIYRQTGGVTTLVGTSKVASYTDLTAQDGLTYLYWVTAVDASGVQSSSSNSYTAVIP